MSHSTDILKSPFSKRLQKNRVFLENVTSNYIKVWNGNGGGRKHPFSRLSSIGKFSLESAIENGNFNIFT